MKASWAKSKVVAVVLLAGVLPLLASVAAHLILGDAKHVLEPLHQGLELAGTCIALAVAMLLLLRLGHENASPHLLWVVAALVAMGIVDGVHSFLPTGVAFSWTRHGATLMGGALFALVWLPLPAVVVRRKQYLVFLVAVLAIAGSLAILGWPDRLPAPWVAGVYSRSVIAANALGGLGFLASALFFIRRYLREPQAEHLVFASQTLLFSAASLFFGFSHVWAADWWVWHGARLLAYGVVLVAAYEMVVTLYRQLGEHAQELEGHVLARTAELVKANDALQTEIVERQRAEAGVEQQSEEQARLNAELKRSNRATLNLMQDALAAKQMLEEANQNLRQEIAQRQQAEERVRAEKRISDSLIQSLPGVFYLFDANGRFLRWNANFERVTGYSAAELAALSPLDLFVGEERALMQRQIQAVFVDGQAEAETNLFTKQGDRTPYYFTGLRIELDGQPCLLGVGLDLTSRRQAEAALHEAQSLRAEAEKLGKVGGWEFDTETKAVTWTEEVFHIHEVDLTYQPTVDAGIDFYAPASRPIIAQAVQRAIEQGEPFDVELEIVTAKGNRRYVHSIGRTDPTRRKVLGFFQDITAQKHAEEEVRNLNAELEQRVRERTAQLETANADLRANRSLIEVIYRSQAQFIAADASQDMFDDLLDSLLDLTGSEYGFIDEMFYTPDGKPYLTARAITDISWNEQTRQMYAQFVSGELNFTKLESLFGAVMATGKPVIANDAPNDPRRGGVPPGHPALDAFLGLPLHSNNRFVGVIGLANRPGGYSEELIAHLEPVVQACASLLSAWRSERKREEAEAALVRKTAELEAANKDLEAFSYSVSHDLRAPLRAIDGFGRILVEDYAGSLDPEGRRVLGVISSETRRMGQLVDDLLAFSRLGRQKLESSEINMAAKVRTVFEEQAAQVPQRIFQLELSPLPPAHGDPAMILVVLGNLLSNAIKFTKSRNPAVIEIGSRLEDGQVVYFVKDNGVGFDMRYAHKLFGVFQRLHSTEEFEGTGVGLALVQRVIHRHGGRVWAEGKVDEGATFYFSLPDMREES